MKELREQYEKARAYAQEQIRYWRDAAMQAEGAIGVLDELIRRAEGGVVDDADAGTEAGTGQ